MTQIFLTSRELNTGDLPQICMKCGSRDAYFVKRRLEKSTMIFGGIRTKWIVPELPFCGAHERRQFAEFSRIDIAQFTDQGVWVKNLSPRFVDALWDHRERAEQRYLKVHPNAELDPERWPERGDPDFERKSTSGRAWLFILLLLGIPVLCVGGIVAIPFIGVFLHRGIQPGPPQVQQPAFVPGPVRPQQVPHFDPPQPPRIPKPQIPGIMQKGRRG